ncbi:hypothetical protein DFR29_1262 [Tahibacter aquaticus]|uniref:Uncharacterized protein n=1 Tax=Tahibacter aquaticus TaxID=520092 RepID=A0A4R6YJ14_9GAMM|nr:hypothetical protein [Tahibacter aquaticus]TDR36967.1 hypothetical protein DFR29_1262 [Tahibacter aquaticus]
MIIGSVTQPYGDSNLQVLARTLEAVDYDHVDVAAAYVTLGGARDMLQMLEHSLRSRWLTARKRWVVSFDYCRSEPLAIKMLKSAPASHVRIHDGSRVVSQLGVPKTPFHPKAFLLHGGGGHSVFAGSGNLSRSGLNTGNEVGLLIGVTAQEPHPSILAHVKAVQKWYESIWQQADKLDPSLMDRYSGIFDSVPNRSDPVPTDDDVIEHSRQPSGLTPGQLRKLRVCSSLWIEAGKISRNLGKAVPGNQLMMKRLSRVFFGVPVLDVTPNSPLTVIEITFQSHTKSDCSLTFSDNTMDKLTLPLPGAGGPPAYDEKTLLFKRISAGKYKMVIGDEVQKRDWLRESKRVDAAWEMRGGRVWGVF